MPKINYKILVPVLLIGLIALYLYFAHAFIFYYIGQANLKPVDTQKTHIINGGVTTSSELVYTAIGDSLTAGAGVNDYAQSFPYLVASKIAGHDQRVVLNNYSVPGYRTDDLINYLVNPALASSSNIITLLVGTNDVHGNINEKDFSQNYRTILDKLKTVTDAKVYIISIPFIGSRSLILPPYNIYYDQRIINFNKIIFNLAQEYNFNYVDIATPTKDLFKSDGAHYSADAFHPSAAGYALWANIIYDTINK